MALGPELLLSQWEQPCGAVWDAVLVVMWRPRVGADGAHLGPADACSCRQVFPHGLPPEFTLILTLLLKKNSTGEHWYLFQVTDRHGYPQVRLWDRGMWGQGTARCWP